MCKLYFLLLDVFCLNVCEREREKHLTDTEKHECNQLSFVTANYYSNIIH